MSEPFFESMSSDAMKDTGALPSRCSGAMQTTPQLARLQRMDEYAFRLPPRPCEKTKTGYGEDLCRRGALDIAGRVVYLMNRDMAETSWDTHVDAPRKLVYALSHSC